MMTIMQRPRSRVLLPFVLVAITACAGRSSRVAAGQVPSILLGDFALAPEPVVDGDTLRVVGLDADLRLIGLDTEETFKKDIDRLESGADFAAYLKAKRGDSKRPVKMGSPLGEEAKQWAKDLLSGVAAVRLERDRPFEISDRYGRLLAYVLFQRHGEWLNFNIECVRAGMSPYFSKYGYSKRFHDQFVQAQTEARAAQRGIWDPNKQHYPDYDERLAWWDDRARFLAAFEQEAEGRNNYFLLSQANVLHRMEQLVDHEVVLVGSVGQIEPISGGPTLALLGVERRRDFALVFYSQDVLGHSRVAELRDELIKVRGVVSRYRNKRTGREDFQMAIRHSSQILGCTSPPAAH